MSTITIRAGSCEEINWLRNEFAVAIDLGFAKQKRSCGLAWTATDRSVEGRKLQFGQCTGHVLQLLDGRSKAILILEAPLSGRFTPNGNPMERGDFEKRQPDSKTGRHWYSGPGAATCLAAVFFLRDLCSAACRDETCHTQSTEIILYEGFETFKVSGTDHARDARLLLDSFLGLHRCDVLTVNAADGEVITVLDLLGHAESPSRAPAIIIPRKGWAEPGAADRGDA